VRAGPKVPMRLTPQRGGATFDTTANDACLASKRLWLDLHVAIP
jgi:hypothetical protein